MSERSLPEGLPEGPSRLNVHRRLDYTTYAWDPLTHLQRLSLVEGARSFLYIMLCSVFGRIGHILKSFNFHLLSRIS